MKLVFIGKPGSGKGTQAKVIANKLDILHISTGDLLRGARKESREVIRSFIDSGKFVPDELMIKILKNKLEEPDAQNGFILDGFPRTLPQAEELEKLFKIDNIIEIHISDEEAIKRMSGRRICRKCGAVYNIHTSYAPKKEDTCDKCGDYLYQRKDQTEEAIKQRMIIYHRDTEPILEKYLHKKIKGEQEIGKVTEDIFEILK
jgi:adenylate kinase